MTREQIEEIAANYGVEVYYAEAGKGGFIIDSSNVIYESLSNIVMEYFDVPNGNKKMYFVDDENIFLAA